MVFRAKLRRLEFDTRQGKLIEAAVVKEVVLQPLILFDWGGSPHGFPLRIPFFITVRGSLIDPPFEAPDTSGLREADHFLWIDGTRTDRLGKCIRTWLRKLAAIRPCSADWKFFENSPEEGRLGNAASSPRLGAEGHRVDA